METSIIKMATSWALARLMERNTWATWIGVAALKFGVTLSPEFDNLIINLALAAIAAIGYAVKGQPIFEKVEKK
jgi:drug/metabolite transporter (DMT)-like permease